MGVKRVSPSCNFPAQDTGLVCRLGFLEKGEV